MEGSQEHTALQNVLKRLSEMDAGTIEEIVRERLPTADGADACEWLTARLQEDTRLKPKPLETGSDPELERTRVVYEAPRNPTSPECWLVIQKQEDKLVHRHGPCELCDAQAKLVQVQGPTKDPNPDNVAAVDQVIEIALLDRLSDTGQVWTNSRIKFGVWPDAGLEAANTYRDLLHDMIAAADAYLTWARE